MPKKYITNITGNTGKTLTKKEIENLIRFVLFCFVSLKPRIHRATSAASQQETIIERSRVNLIEPLL